GVFGGPTGNALCIVRAHLLGKKSQDLQYAILTSMKHTHTVDELTHLITQAAQGTAPFVIAIDGFGGSGKTTLSKQLADKLVDSAVLQVDDFIVTPDPNHTYPYDYDAFEDTLRHIKTDE